MDRYPIMADTDHPTWGLSWQTMPIAFAREGSDWGFWRWGARENGIERHHPATDKHSAYLNNALSDALSPVPVGHTRSQVIANSLVFARIMPRISPDWEWCSDSFELYGFSGTVHACRPIDEHSSQLILDWKDGKFLTLFCINVIPAPHPVLAQEGTSLHWEIKWPKDVLAKRELLTCLWAAQLGTAIPPAPVLAEATQSSVSVQWNGHTYHLDTSSVCAQETGS